MKFHTNISETRKNIIAPKVWSPVGRENTIAPKLGKPVIVPKVGRPVGWEKHACGKSKENTITGKHDCADYG